MQLARIGGTRVTLSPLVLLPILYAFLAEQTEALLLNLLALFLHELCHTFAARAMGYRIASISLAPFGFVARLEQRVSNRWDELAIASAGPIFSLVAGTACAAFCTSQLGAAFAGGSLARFGRINLLLGAINLLPALPLDGGRMLEALLRACLPQRAASRASLFTGVLSAGGILAAGWCVEALGDLRITASVMGGFLLLAVLSEARRAKPQRVDAMLRRYDRIRAGCALPVRELALHKATPAGEALRCIEPEKLTRIRVVDDGLRTLGVLGEEELLFAIARFGEAVPLEKMLLSCAGARGKPD